IASGHGSPLTAPIGTGTVDGFAAGMLLSGVVFLLILAQRRAARRPARASAARVSETPAGPAGEAPAPEVALGQYPESILAAPILAAPVEAEVSPALSADALSVQALSTQALGTQALGTQALSTHPYADVSPFGGASSPASFMPFADAANEVVLQAGVRLEEWLEGEMRRPSLPGSSRAHFPAPETASALATPLPAAVPAVVPVAVPAVVPAVVPAAVAAAEASTAVVPVTFPEAGPPSSATAEEDLGDEPGQRRRASAYQSKHRLSGRSDSKPWPDNHRRAARHAAASSARSGARSRMFGLRQLGPVSAAD
ncbi:MAG: hypothetical protein ACRDPO_22920, partial [Streptosporangiaceae bacterium]